MDGVAVVGIVLAVLGILVSFLAWIFPDFRHWLLPKLGLGSKIVHQPKPLAPPQTTNQPKPLVPPQTTNQPKPSVPPQMTDQSDMATFFEQRSSINKDDIYAQRLFLGEWRNRTVCWLGFVIWVMLGDNGEISHIGMAPTREGNTLGPWVMILRFSTPPALHPTFDVLRMGDRILVEGTLADVLSLPTVNPTRLERL
jgi:hypothetical protein